MKKPRIIFFGSGPVAAKSLELLHSHATVEAVITKPKPEKHRGDFPVITVAQKLALPIHYVSTKAELDALVDENMFESNLGVIIDFGIIVSQKVINAFPLGIINSHFSLLPEWRGADPITFSILSGQTKTGVSLMVIDAGLDTGKLITRRTISIDHNETTPSLTEKLIQLSDELLQEYLPQYLNGDIKPKNQPHPDRATYSRKLTKEDGVIDWHKPAEQIEREIRAFIDWPKSRATLGEKEVIITKAHAHTTDNSQLGKTPGTLHIENSCLAVVCGTGYLCIDILKPAGKNEMPIKAFLAGYKSLLQ